MYGLFPILSRAPLNRQRSPSETTRENWQWRRASGPRTLERNEEIKIRDYILIAKFFRIKRKKLIFRRPRSPNLTTTFSTDSYR